MTHDQSHEQKILDRLKNPEISRPVASFKDVLRDIPLVRFHRLHDEILHFLEEAKNLPNRRLLEHRLYIAACEHLRKEKRRTMLAIVPSEREDDTASSNMSEVPLNDDQGESTRLLSWPLLRRYR